MPYCAGCFTDGRKGCLVRHQGSKPKETPDEPPRKRHSSEEEDRAADERRQRQRKTGFTAGAAGAASTPGGQLSQTPAEIGECSCHQ